MRGGRAAGFGTGLALAAAVFASDPLKETVDAALKAAKTGDERTLALRDEPGLWLIADELCARGEADAALLLARSAREADAARLPAYIEARKKAAGDAEARERFHRVFALMQKRQHGSVREIVGAGPVPEGTVLGVRLRFALGGSLLMSGNVLDGAREVRRAGEAAHELGDLQTASYAFELAGSAFGSAGLYADSEDVLMRQILMDEARGDVGRRLEAIEKLVTVQTIHNDPAGLCRTYDRLTALQRELGNHDALCATLAKSAIAHLDAGRMDEALKRAEQSLALIDGVFDAAVHSQAYLGASAAYGATGDGERALEYARKSLEANVEEGDVDGRIRSLAVIAGIHQSNRDTGKAEAELRKALALVDEAELPASALPVLELLVGIESSKGNFERALELAKDGVGRARATRSPRRYANAVHALAGVHLSKKEYGDALAALDQLEHVPNALSVTTTRLGHQGMRAECLRGLGRTDEAAKLVAEVVDEAFELCQGLGAEQGAGARSNVWWIFDTAVSVAHGAGDPALLYEFQEKARAVVLLQSLGGSQRVQLALVPRETRERFAEARSRYRSAAIRLEEARKAGLLKEARRRRDAVEAARKELTAALAAVERESARTKELIRPDVSPLESVRGQLGADEAYVAYSVIGRDACALVATKSSARIVPLPDRASVRKKLDAAAFGDSREDVAGAVAALRELLVEPLGLDGKAKRVLLSPNAPVAQVPFAALMPERTVVYLPSMTAAAQLASAEREPGAKVLALGDPAYAGDWKPLPHTRVEAESIGDVVLLGAKATRAGLREALGRETSWRAVHPACHGVVDLENPALSGLALTDGRLSCFDVLQMDVPADLVTLSACETGRGKAVRNEGVFGLTRAFLSAGAARVLVSLWPVEDEATQALMREFYRLWKEEKKAPGDALRMAQASVRGEKKWKHPAYWAAWQLWGAYR